VLVIVESGPSSLSWDSIVGCSALLARNGSVYLFVVSYFDMIVTAIDCLSKHKRGETCVSWFFREPGFLPFLARHIRAFLRLGYFPGEATFWGAEGISCDSSTKKGLCSEGIFFQFVSLKIGHKIHFR
jgi:hypothetical protein